MPTVPGYGGQQAAPTSNSGNPFAAPVVQDASGQQLQQAGQALQQASGVAANVYADMQHQANQLRVDDALNKAKEASLFLTYDKDTGYSNQKGISALERSSGKPLADEYADTLQEKISGFAAGLSNDAQRQAFAMRSNDLLTQFHGQAIQHEAQEYRNYGLSVSEGVQSTALREIGLNYRDQDAVRGAVGRIQAETYRTAQLLGKSAEWQEMAARKMTSNAHKTALLSALEQNDPLYADDYLKSHAKEMEADDILTVRGHITKEVNNQVGVRVAADVVGKIAPLIAPSEMDRAFNIAVGTESGGRQFDAKGAPLASVKGAIGIAQVMPATAPEAAKLAGLPWDEERYKNDADYNKAIGKAYFQKQMQDNGGDLAKAYAAYNAGPGAVQAAIKRADQSVKLNKTDPSVQAHTYIDFLPKETREYVTKNMAAYSAGGGVAAQKPTFLEIDNALRADPRLANNPQRYAIARADAERRFEETQKAVKTREEEGVASAMRGVIQNGGRYSDLPVAVRANLPPKEVDNVIAFAQKVAKGDDTTNPRLYDRLTNNPAQLAQMSDNGFFALRSELSDGDFKHFSAERAKLQGKSGGAGAGDLNSQAIKQALDQRLALLKIDSTPKSDGGEDNARVGAIRQFTDQYFYTAQREAGKKFSDAEVTQHLDALFAKNATYRGFFSNSSGAMLGMKTGDIGSEIKDKIKAAYKKQGIDNPTDAQIMNIYWTSQTARK